MRVGLARRVCIAWGLWEEEGGREELSCWSDSLQDTDPTILIFIFKCICRILLARYFKHAKILFELIVANPVPSPSFRDTQEKGPSRQQQHGETAQEENLPLSWNPGNSLASPFYQAAFTVLGRGGENGLVGDQLIGMPVFSGGGREKLGEGI